MPPRRDHGVHLPLNERIKDGRIFEISTRTDTGVIYMRCTTRFCVGTAKRNLNGDIVALRGHSDICFADRNAQLKADFRNALKTALHRNFWKLNDVYETVVAMYPREVRVLVPYNSIVNSLKRWRKAFYPPCPENLEEMAIELANPANNRLLEYDVGRLVSRRINDRDGNLHLLIYDPQFVESEFANVSRIFIDGTFKTTPRLIGVYQLISILGVKYDHALPFAHILMANKTQHGYTAVLTEIKNLINSASVSVVLTDFEQALRNACKDTFVNAHVTGCNFHYDQALFKKSKSLRLTPVVREHEDAKLFVKKVMVLAYLPKELIVAEYTALKNALSPAMKRSLASFLSYYERQWLRIVKPTGFSVFGLTRRTNNVVESYNSVLKDKLGEHPSPWTFMTKLIRLTSNARDDVQSLRLNKRIRRQPRYATIYKQKELTNAWKQLYTHLITPAEFLDKAAMLKGHITQRLANIPEEPLDDTVQMEQTPDDVRFPDPDYDYGIFRGEHYFGHENAEAPFEADAAVEADAPLPANNHARNDMSDIEPEEEMDAELDIIHNARPGEERLQPGRMELESSIEDSETEPEEMIQVGIDANNVDMADMVRVANIEVPAAAQQDQANARASSSRKKNLRKKMRRRMKAQSGDGQVRPYGHKRRTTGRNKQAPTCVVCYVNPISHGFVPCGHNCSCLRCALILAEQEIKRCPKCRANFTQYMAIYNEA